MKASSGVTRVLLCINQRTLFLIWYSSWLIRPRSDGIIAESSAVTAHCKKLEPSTLLPNTSPVFGHKHPTQDSIPVRYWEFPRTLPHAGTTSTLFLPVDMRLIPGQPLNHPCSISFPHDFPAIIPPKKPPA
ncbi:hypothetical protein CGRA01v4_07925 [Colletotrichum graminicola]|nr:hypothetical protein CGRA01v4_07925 [Colletotrichum graminicola]